MSRIARGKAPNPGLRASERGFTLLELLVAVAILGMIMAMIWAAFYRTAESKEYVEKGNEVYESAHIAVERMAREISMAFIAPGTVDEGNFTQFIGSDKQMDTYPADELTFTSLSHQRYALNVRESDQNEINYYLLQDPETQQKNLMYREKTYIDKDHTSGGVAYELCPDVLALDFQYWDGEEWKAEWDSTTMQENQAKLPRAVQITLVLKGPDNREVVFQTKSVIEMY